MYNTMSVRKNFRISDREQMVLSIYCKEIESSETDVVRELIRSLEEKLTQEGKQLLGNMSKSGAV
jgi:hypothetical protein